MKHLLEISQLSSKELTALFERALYFKNNADYPSYKKSIVANLFYENSTRTRVSFELAANNLSMPVVNLDLHSSSESKGETIKDTVKNLAAMGVKIFVIRHMQDGLPQKIADFCQDSIHIINAGDGIHAHPSQALLDFMTIMEKKSDISMLKIAIVGNICHSRVANSWQVLAAKLAVKELVLIAPDLWKPKTIHHGHFTTSLRDGIKDADIVVCLRVQQERLNRSEEIDLVNYHRDYAITAESLGFAKKDAYVMHPGPINRGIEIDNDVADGPRSLILQQVSNGVFMRMAILESLVSGPN